MRISDEKLELIKQGKYQSFLKGRKDQYNEDIEPTEDPSYYGLTLEEMPLIKAIFESDKRKKRDFRQHTRFMSEIYDNVGFLTLTWSDERIGTSLEWKKECVTDFLGEAFEDYLGKFELSSKGRIHWHGIVAWNGEVDELKNSQGHMVVVSVYDLRYWSDTYGVYELRLINKTYEDLNKTTNYTMKNLNSVNAYVNKSEEILPDVEIDSELLIAVNSSNVMTKRGTPYQKWKHAYVEQIKDIRHLARVFDTHFYEAHKWEGNKPFRLWVMEQKPIYFLDREKNIPLIAQDFELVNVEDYRRDKST